MAQHHAKSAGIETPIDNHAIRATGITTYQKTGHLSNVAQSC